MYVIPADEELSEKKHVKKSMHCQNHLHEVSLTNCDDDDDHDDGDEICYETDCVSGCVHASVLEPRQKHQEPSLSNEQALCEVVQDELDHSPVKVMLETEVESQRLTCLHCYIPNKGYTNNI